MTRTNLKAIVIAAVLLAPGLAAAAPIVADGSFETPVVPGFQYNPTGSPWTFLGDSGLAQGTFFAGVAPDGAQAAFLQSAGLVGEINQTLGAVTIGSKYLLSFYVADRPGYVANPVDVKVDGVDLSSFTSGSTSFVKETVNFIATTTTPFLQSIGGPAGGDIDSAIDLVTVTPAGTVSTPEPAALALLGIGGVSLAARRRRRR